MLPSALFAILLASFGGPDVMVTMMDDAGKGGYWQCTECKRIEWKPVGKDPRCSGIPGRPHHSAGTIRLTGSSITPTDDDEYFV
jgi:hypothetical protein